MLSRKKHAPCMITSCLAVLRQVRHRLWVVLTYLVKSILGGSYFENFWKSSAPRLPPCAAAANGALVGSPLAPPRDSVVVVVVIVVVVDEVGPATLVTVVVTAGAAAAAAGATDVVVVVVVVTVRFSTTTSLPKYWSMRRIDSSVEILLRS